MKGTQTAPTHRTAREATGYSMQLGRNRQTRCPRRSPSSRRDAAQLFTCSTTCRYVYWRPPTSSICRQQTRRSISYAPSVSRQLYNCYIWLASWLFWRLAGYPWLAMCVTGLLWQQCNTASQNGLEGLSYTVHSCLIVHDNQ